jgi:hypothetical protein
MDPSKRFGSQDRTQLRSNLVFWWEEFTVLNES